MGGLLAVAALGLASLTSPLVYADDPLARPEEPAARKHLEAGEAFYKLAKWDEAVVEFEKGALLTPNLPVWYFALGQAHRQAGHYERARWYFERFLSSIDESDPDAADAATTARELIDDMNAAQKRPPTEAAPASVPRTSVEAPTFTTSRKAALVVGGVGLLAAGAGVAFGMRADGFEDDAAEICPMDSCTHADEANALLERGQDNALYANIGYGMGAAAVVGAVVLWLVGTPEKGERDQLAVTPRFSDTFAGVNVSLGF